MSDMINEVLNGGGNNSDSTVSFKRSSKVNSAEKGDQLAANFTRQFLTILVILFKTVYFTFNTTGIQQDFAANNSQNVNINNPHLRTFLFYLNIRERRRRNWVYFRLPFG